MTKERITQQIISCLPYMSMPELKLILKFINSLIRTG